jgi:PAS domain S-box-containing protein
LIKIYNLQDAYQKLKLKAVEKSNVTAIFDQTGNILSTNQNFCDVLGYDSETLKGKHHSLLLPMQYAKSEESKALWSAMLTGETVSGEFLRIGIDGREVWLNGYYTPVRNSFGIYSTIVFIAADQTALKNGETELEQKNAYLRHAARILRHDMHSGINIYIPRGLKALRRKLTKQSIEELKIEGPIKLIEAGLKHTQKVYEGVKEFTNLVKDDAGIETVAHDLKVILTDFLKGTSYQKEVVIDDLCVANVNDALFCTAIDNIIRNGLTYNDSATKIVRIYMLNDILCIEDNGRGMSKEEFDYLSKPYIRRENQKESGSGLGLSICISILKEHGFTITSERIATGTIVKIKLKGIKND